MINEPLGRVVIVCEGAQDDSFFRHLIGRRRLGDITTAYPEKPHPGGRSGFSSLLRAMTTVRGFENVRAVVVTSDNDGDPRGSFNEVTQQIDLTGAFGVPSQPNEWTTGRGTPDLLVYMLPEAGTVGNLETLCLRAADEKWPEITVCVQTFAECTGAANWPENKRAKMRLRSLLAAVCKDDPNTGLQTI